MSVTNTGLGLVIDAYVQDRKSLVSIFMSETLSETEGPSHISERFVRIAKNNLDFGLLLKSLHEQELEASSKRITELEKALADIKATVTATASFAA